jgi:uncharacterized membrane-anchored protein
MTGSRMALIAGAVLVLGVINFSIAGKERIKRDGDVVYLDLAPIDPRSLMQGDYMALRFRLAQEIERSFQAGGVAPLDGEQRLASVALDERRIASLAKPGAAAPLAIRWRMRKGAVWLGTNAFFFEEGSEQRYSAARYGEFRVDRESGEAVLVGLRDARLQPL